MHSADHDDDELHNPWTPEQLDAYRDHVAFGGGPSDRREFRWRTDDDQRSASEWAAENRTRWPDTRLQAELDDLRARYFPDLRGGWMVRAVVIPTESDAYRVLGSYLRHTGEIVVDLWVPGLRSARKVRSTLLHELCHAAVFEADMHAQPHGVEFLREVERILSLGAPIHERFFYTDTSDARVAEIVADLPLCRSRYQRQVARRLKVRSSS